MMISTVAMELAAVMTTTMIMLRVAAMVSW